MNDEQIDPQTEEKQAIERIARTPDGLLLHRFLRRILESCRLAENSGALQRHEGGRMLARDLMGHMAQGIEDTASGGRSSADQPVIATGAKPIRAGKRLTFREHALANDPECARKPDDASRTDEA